jgi:hypothetical protein
MRRKNLTEIAVELLANLILNKHNNLRPEIETYNSEGRNLDKQITKTLSQIIE